MRVYHIGSYDCWDIEIFRDPDTGKKYQVPTAQLCPDCYTPAIEVGRETRIIHNQMCPLALGRRVNR